MLLEFIIIASFLFAVFVWFYKQRRSELELLQVEFAQAATSLRDLAQEKQPIIIRGVPQPPVLTSDRLAEIPRLAEFPLLPLPPGSPPGRPVTLGAYRAARGNLLPDWQAQGIPITSPEAGAALATELAVPLWVERSLHEALLDLGTLPFITFTNSRVAFGGYGLQKAIGSFVCILPTEGTYIVSMVSASSETYLPKAWENRYPQSFTINDTPMVAEIKYIDVVLRPGTMICIPAQTLYSIEPKDRGPNTFHAHLILEVHNPVSKLASLLESL